MDQRTRFMGRWKLLRRLVPTRRASSATGKNDSSSPTLVKKDVVSLESVSLETSAATKSIRCDVCAFVRRADCIGCPRCGDGVPRTPSATQAVQEADVAAAAAGCPYHQKLAAAAANGNGSPEQRQMNKAFEGPDFELAARYGVILNNIFSSMLYSAGSPVFYLVAAATCGFTYLAGGEKDVRCKL